jgi:hypothetical protein
MVDDCIVCLETRTYFVTLGECGHAVCYACFARIVETKRCPLCRAPLVPLPVDAPRPRACIAGFQPNDLEVPVARFPVARSSEIEHRSDYYRRIGILRQNDRVFLDEPSHGGPNQMMYVFLIITLVLALAAFVVGSLALRKTLEK